MQSLLIKTIQPTKEKLTKKEALEKLWELGETCTMLLDAAQKEIETLYKTCEARAIVACYARQSLASLG